jgi:hypothetical protein
MKLNWASSELSAVVDILLSFFLSFLNRPLLPCGVEGFLLVNL